jgi:BASS family bile acid:Na+ symporter
VKNQVIEFDSRGKISKQIFMRQVIFILSAIVLGIVFPFGHHYTFLVRYFVMAMLFLAFLGIRFHSRILTRLHLKVLAANLLLPLALFALLYPLGYTYAISAFVIAIAPTAAGAPVISGFMRADIAVVTVSVILTSPVVALALPFILPLLMGPVSDLAVIDLVLPILSLVFIPLLLSQGIKRYWLSLHDRLLKYQFLAFYLFLGNVFIASGKAVHFITTDETTSLSIILGIALITGLVCVLSFQFGQFLGGKTLPIEASMALGRKNTMFALWVALTFVSPVAALGPIFYILFQNLYNSWQIWRINSEGFKE